jgi:class 3 adenylate cyclase
MEPSIRYTKTSDGVNIAYWVMGEGRPLVYMPPLPQHLQLNWRMPHIRELYEVLAAGRQLITFDGRNTGLSDRGVTDASNEARLLDMEAVANRVGLEVFDVLAHGTSAALGISFAALNPERVRRLILVDASLPQQGMEVSAPVRALQLVLDVDWETFTEMVSGIVWGWAAGEASQRYAELFRASITRDDWKRNYDPDAAATFDASMFLARIKAPTLIVHHTQAVATSLEGGRRLAAAIANSHLVPLEGRGVAASYNDPRFVSAVNEFLSDESGRAHEVSAERAAGGFSTLLFTDIEGSTALTDRLGDAAARNVLREHERITREALNAHGGSEVKTMGDGFMASFGSATKALECAVAIQRAFDAPESTEHGIRVRIGLNAGEPIAEDDDLFGTAVIVAARIAAQAQGGEILVSDVVRQLVAGKGFLFNDRGEHALKGFEDPVRVWEVRWVQQP